VGEGGSILKLLNILVLTSVESETEPAYIHACPPQNYNLGTGKELKTDTQSPQIP
jgi:hypothetical protein